MKVKYIGSEILKFYSAIDGTLKIKQNDIIEIDSIDNVNRDLFILLDDENIEEENIENNKNEKEKKEKKSNRRRIN